MVIDIDYEWYATDNRTGFADAWQIAAVKDNCHVIGGRFFNMSDDAFHRRQKTIDSRNRTGVVDSRFLIQLAEGQSQGQQRADGIAVRLAV